MYTATDIGKIIRRTRINLNLSQEELATTAGTRTRFISDLENGKSTCQLGKTLVVIQMLGIDISLIEPEAIPENINRENSKRQRVRKTK